MTSLQTEIVVFFSVAWAEELPAHRQRYEAMLWWSGRRRWEINSV